MYGTAPFLPPHPCAWGVLLFRWLESAGVCKGLFMPCGTRKSLLQQSRAWSTAPFLQRPPTFIGEGLRKFRRKAGSLHLRGACSRLCSALKRCQIVCQISCAACGLVTSTAWIRMTSEDCRSGRVCEGFGEPQTRCSGVLVIQDKVSCNHATNYMLGSFFCDVQQHVWPQF